MYRYSALLNYQCLYPQTYWHKENGKGPSMTKLIRGQFGRSTWTRPLDLGMDIKEEIVLEGIIWSEVLYRCDMWVSTKDHQVWTGALGQPDELLSSYIIPVCQDCIILLSLSWYSQDLEQHGPPQCKGSVLQVDKADDTVWHHPLFPALFQLLNLWLLAA